MKNDLMECSNIKWTCQCCGIEQFGLPMAFAYSEPHNWQFIDTDVKEKSYLGEDFCIINHTNGQVERYLRCILHFNAIELDEPFEFGVWMSVSESSMKIYKDGLISGEYAEPDCFGFLMHSLPEYENTWALECTLVFRENNLRPIVWLNKTDHALFYDQSNGISVDYIKRLVSH